MYGSGSPLIVLRGSLSNSSEPRSQGQSSGMQHPESPEKGSTKEQSYQARVDLSQQSTTKVSVVDRTPEWNAASSSLHAGGSAHSAEADPQARCGVGLCPWDSWLCFWDQDNEAKFWRSRMDRLLRKLDIFCYGHIVVDTIIMWCQLRSSGYLSPLMVHIRCLLVASISAWLGFHVYSRSHWYDSNRQLVVCLLRVFLHLMLAQDMAAVGAPGVSASQFLTRMASKSTAPAMLFSALVLQVQFKQQLLVSSICLILTAVQGCALYCGSWFERDALSGIATPICESTDSVVQAISFLRWQGADILNQIGRGRADKCCVLVSFIHTLLGVVLPGAILYCWECFSRLHFLLEANALSRVQARRILYVKLGMTSWFAVVATAALWVCMSQTPLFMVSVPAC